MKTETEIRKAFERLVACRDGCDKPSAAWSTLNQRILALAWVLDHPDVKEVELPEKTLDLLNCLS